MMRTLRCLIALAGLAALVGCQTVDVSFEYDPNASYADWQTWSWRSLAPAVEGLGLGVQELDRDLRAAIEAELGAKGFEKTDGAPDFLVAYSLKVVPETRAQKIQTIDLTDAVWGASYDRPVYITSDVGTLVVVLSDAQQASQVWSGTARGRADRSDDPGKIARNLEEVVDDVLANFPPRG